MPKTATALSAEMLSSLENLVSDLPGEAHVRSYSGRGMCGRSCLAISGEISLFTLGLMIGQDVELADIFNCAGEPREDSMGRGVVIYWPRIAAPDTTEEGE
jgi:hypothetical protein